MSCAGLAAALHAAAVGLHCPGGEHASTKDNNQSYAHSFVQVRSYVRGIFFHSKAVYYMPHCAVNRLMNKNIPSPGSMESCPMTSDFDIAASSEIG